MSTRLRNRTPRGGILGANLVLDWPLTGANINPILPFGLTPTVTRASTKVQQMTLPTAESFANNVLKPTVAFDDNAIAGTPIESAYSNDIIDSIDLTTGNWSPLFVSIAGGQTDPLGGANAFRLTPSSTSGRLVQNTGVDCKDKAVVGSIWARAVTGSHVATMTLSNGEQFEDRSLPVTTAWRRFPTTAADSAFTSVGDFFIGIYPDEDNGTAEIDVYMPAAVVNTTLWATPAFETRAHDSVVLDVSPANVPGMRLDRGSILFDAWNLFEVGNDQTSFFALHKSSAIFEFVHMQSIRLRFLTDFGGLQTVILSTVGGIFNKATSHKIGLTYGPDTINIFLNGTKATAVTTQSGSGALESGTTLHLGREKDAQRPNSIMSNFKWYDGVQSDAFMIAATTP